MNALLVVNAYAKVKGITYQTERLIEELQKREVSATCLTTAQLKHEIVDGKICFDKAFDFVIFLDKDDYAAQMLAKSGVRMFNPAEAIRLCDDKMLTYIALADHDLPMPETIPSLLCYSQNAEPAKEFLDHVERKLSFPLIAKTSFGSLGKGVYLIPDREALEHTEKELQYFPHLYQKFISAHQGTDIRIIVIGEKAVACMKRCNPKDYRSNIECGGFGEKIDPPPRFIEIAQRAAEILQLDYCGVDLLIDENNEPVLCEVNSNAFFTGIESCTGVDVAKAYVEHILHCVRKS